ncbi:hypothetical protein ANO11243_062140 [Dothideomycetidae sp. 11243]|nr:hypothetical protein ANO11243_062140 [fungal sp. No.11243]
MALFNGTMAIIGLVESGGFAQMSTDGWRWVFYFNAIFFALSAALIAIVYNPPPPKLRRELSAISAAASVDFIGLALLLIGVILLVVGLTWGGSVYAWKSPHVITTIVVGGFGLVAFGLYETYGCSDGIIDHRFLEHRNFLLILSVAFVDGMLLYGVNAFYPVEVTGIFTSNLLKANLYLLPLNIFVLVGCFGAAAFLGRLKHYRTFLVVTLAVLSLFLGLLILVTPSRPAMADIFTGVIGLCTGVTTVIPPVILSYSVPSHLLGTSETVLAATRGLGGTIGITIFASVFGNAMKANLPTGVAKAAVEAGLPTTSVKQFIEALLGGVGSLTDVKGATAAVIGAAVSAIKTITAQSFHGVWMSVAP